MTYSSTLAGIFHLTEIHGHGRYHKGTDQGSAVTETMTVLILPTQYLLFKQLHAAIKCTKIGEVRLLNVH